MSQFNERFDGLSNDRRSGRYMRLAEAALKYYAVGDVEPVFIRHNGGVTYRLEAPGGPPLYLLKIAQPAGENGATSPQQLTRVMEWLAYLAHEGTIVVQEPVRNIHNEWLSAVEFEDLFEPFHCSVQRWIDGVHVRGPFTPLQAHRVGMMIGHLHEHSSQWRPRVPVHGICQDEAWLADHLAPLNGAVVPDILTPAEWGTVEAATEQIAQTMQGLGKAAGQWGAVHGDLHHENLLFHGETVRPIDFADLYLAHFPYDLGVVLYHLMYLDDVRVRQAILTGYQSVRNLPAAPFLWPEVFVCAAALSNLAFQSTIPSERQSVHFARNVREFANSFCCSVVSGDPFVLT